MIKMTRDCLEEVHCSECGMLTSRTLGTSSCWRLSSPPCKRVRTVAVRGLLLAGLLIQWRWLIVFFVRPPVPLLGNEQIGTTATGVRLHQQHDNQTSLDDNSTWRDDSFHQAQRGIDDDISCSVLDDSCIDRLAASIRRVWPIKPMETWCRVGNDTTKMTTKSTNSSASGGLLRLIKVPKSASSTAAGVVLRIQHVHKCWVQWDHGRAADVVVPYFVNTAVPSSNDPRDPLSPGESMPLRQKQQHHHRHSLFLVAPVRTPHSRALSVVYYNQISFHRRRHRPNQQPKTPADSFILKHLQQIPPNYICDYLQVDLPYSDDGNQKPASTLRTESNERTFNQSVTSPFHTVSSPTPSYDNLTTAADVRNYVQGIVQVYDFMLVANRMDESLVVLSLLANLPLTSVLTLSSKSTGSWYLTRHPSKTRLTNSSSSQYQCIRLVPPVLTPTIQGYFASESWQQRQAADRLLFATANKSLDATISTLPTFTNHYETFVRWQRLIQKRCDAGNATRATTETFFPCSSTGVPQLSQSKHNCYERDFGCGYPCVDKIVGETMPIRL